MLADMIRLQACLTKTGSLLCPHTKPQEGKICSWGAEFSFPFVSGEPFHRMKHSWLQKGFSRHSLRSSKSSWASPAAFYFFGYLVFGLPIEITPAAVGLIPLLPSSAKNLEVPVLHSLLFSLFLMKEKDTAVSDRKNGPPRSIELNHSVLGQCSHLLKYYYSTKHTLCLMSQPKWDPLPQGPYRGLP